MKRKILQTLLAVPASAAAHARVNSGSDGSDGRPTFAMGRLTVEICSGLVGTEGRFFNQNAGRNPVPPVSEM